MSIKTVPPVSSGLETFDSRFGIPRPYGFVSGLGADFESIATVTVGSGGASSIEFTSIPSTFAHLHIRAISKQTGSAGDGSWSALMQFGSSGVVDTGSNYARHRIYSDIGAGTVGADGFSSQTSMFFDRSTYGTSATANIFGAGICTILDYTSTTKNKTMELLGGSPTSYQYDMYVNSGLWMSTNVLDTIRILPRAPFTGFAQHSTFALYGIKAP